MLGVDLFWGEFLDGAVPDGRDGVSVVEAVMGITRADVVYGHSPNDSHQDHRATATVTMAAARQILFYASPSTYRIEPTHFIDVDSLVEGRPSRVRFMMCRANFMSVEGPADVVREDETLSGGV